MKTGHKFTPARLDRWLARGRGTGTGADYQPWHQVTRDDPGSHGRSHLYNWRFKRLHHLLSDKELTVLGFISMLPNVVDVFEQFPLNYETHEAERALADAAFIGQQALGTKAVADDLGLKHPKVSQDGISRPWVMSTDVLIKLVMPNGKTDFLSVSVKLDNNTLTRRALELLRIEREYWLRQGVFWLLITPSTFSPGVGNGIRAGMGWALDSDPFSPTLIDQCGALEDQFHERSMQHALLTIEREFMLDRELAQRLFWQSVWAGMVPLDLSRPLRPAVPLQMLGKLEFWAQNPVVSRRTAWTT